MLRVVVVDGGTGFALLFAVWLVELSLFGWLFSGVVGRIACGDRCLGCWGSDWLVGGFGCVYCVLDGAD